MLVVPLFELFWAFTLVLLSCELGSRISNEFEEINERIDQLKWYLFPLEMRRLMMMIEMNSQEWVGFACFGSIPCDRETFKKVRWIVQLIKLKAISRLKHSSWIRRWLKRRFQTLWFFGNFNFFCWNKDVDWDFLSKLAFCTETILYVSSKVFASLIVPKLILKNLVRAYRKLQARNCLARDKQKTIGFVQFML